MSKCIFCGLWGLKDFMLKPLADDKTQRVCLSCSTLIKKYGKAKAREITSNSKRLDNKRKRWNNGRNFKH